MSIGDVIVSKEDVIKNNRVTSKIALILLFMVFLVILVGTRMFVIIKPGQMGVLWSFFSGTIKEYVLLEGINIKSPLNNVYIYDTRLQSLDRSYSMQTKEGLDIQLEVNIRIRPDTRSLPELHQLVGPNYVDKVVIPQVEAVVRRALGQYRIDEIYSSSKGFAENLLVSSIESIESRYVTIDRVLVKSIRLPESFKRAIENKLALEQESKAYEFRLDIAKKEANRQVIEAQGINDAQKIVGQSLSTELLRWHGIVATKDLSKSPNAKTVIYGAGRDGLPLIMNDKQ